MVHFTFLLREIGLIHETDRLELSHFFLGKFITDQLNHSRQMDQVQLSLLYTTENPNMFTNKKLSDRGCGERRCSVVCILDLKSNHSFTIVSIS